MLPPCHPKHFFNSLLVAFEILPLAKYKNGRSFTLLAFALIGLLSALSLKEKPE